VRTAIIVSLLAASPLFALRPRITGPTDLQIACFVWAGNRPAIEETLEHVAAHRNDSTLAPFFIAHADRVAAGRGLYEWMHERAHCAPVTLNMTADEAYSYRESVEIVAAVRIR
jgi:hypothetical protein